MNYSDKIGENIRAVRIEQGLSQQELANKCDISNTTLSAYENGKRNPSMDTTALIARQLKVSIERLYYGDDSMSFINEAPDEGRKIVNSLYYLWEHNVIWYNRSSLAIMGEMYSGNVNEYSLDILRYYSSVIRLITGLIDLSYNKSSYDDYEGAIEILLSSVAKAINDQIASENERESRK